MVSIIIPTNSLTDLVNAGMAVRYYAKRGERTKVFFVNENNIEQFWIGIREYVDSQDNSLLILNLPLPPETELKKIDLEPYEYSILYIPSHLIAISPEDKEILLEKGIAIMPQRNVYKCFPGNYAGQIEKKWIEINKVISFESEKITEGSKVRIVKGLIRALEEGPKCVVEKIADDDEKFFNELGKKPSPKIFKRVCGPDLELVYTEGGGRDLLEVAFLDFLSGGRIPIGIKGEKEFMFLIDSPTFAHSVLENCNLKAEYEMRLGKGVAIFTNLSDDAMIGLLLGRLAQKFVIIRTGRPEFTTMKTLMRRFIGGKGPGGRSYRGIIEKFPEMEFRRNLVSAPRGAIEEVIDTLKETGTKFKIVV
jgi:hypothetical protein